VKTSTRKSLLINYGILLACSAVACLPLFRAGFYQGHDWIFEFVRIAEYSHSLKEGVFPVRWGANLAGGYGSPIYIFFPPVFLLVCGLFSILGMTFVASTKLAVFLLTVAGGIGMYWFSRELFGERGGMLAACLYILAPYHFVDVFVRNAFSEFAALCIVPFVFYSVTVILSGDGPAHRARVVFALSLSLFVLSHNLSAVMYAPAIIVYSLTVLLLNRRWDRLLRLLAPAAVSLFMVSFYALPLVFEKRYVQLWRMTVGKFRVLDNLEPLRSLVEGGSWYSVTLFAPALVAVVATTLIIKRKKMERALFVTLSVLVAMLACYVFLITPHSKAIWQGIGFLSIFQFPWRLLSPATFVLCALSGYVVFLAGESKRAQTALAAGVVVMGAVFLLTQYPAGGGSYVDIRDGSLSAERIRADKLPATVMQEYSTVWAKRGMSPANVRTLAASDGKARIGAYEDKPDSLKFKVALPESTSITAHIYYFPGWKAYSDGEEIPLGITPSGLIEISLPEGEHLVKLKFENTPVRTVAGLVSLAGLAGFLWLLVLAVRPPKGSQSFRLKPARDA
jgi:hypothetical protein